MAKANHQVKFLVIGFVIIAFACLLAYLNSLNNPFIWDDEALILKNPLIKDWRLWHQAFRGDLYSGVASGSNFYRPIQTLSYIWDYYFWHLDPFGYHLTNIILQILVAGLVLLFVYGTLKEIAVAFATALLFALNPLATESVTYISGRAELFLGLFLLSSLLAFQKSESGKFSIIYLVLSLFLFTLGLLSKELAVVFPLVILAYVFYFASDKLKKKGFFAKKILPFFIIAGVYMVLRLSILKFPTIRPSALLKLPLILRVTVLPEVVFTYLKLLILPVNLHMSWTLAAHKGFIGTFIYWFLLGIIVVSCAYLLKYKRDKKTVPFMLFWFLVFFLPQSGIFPINAFIAEHFIYLSSISFFILASYLLYRYLRRELFVFSIIGIGVFYGMFTLARNFEWHDPLIFFEKTIRFSPQSFQAHINLGRQYEYIHQYEKALNEYKKTLEIMPELLEAHSNLANLYFKMGKFAEAKMQYAIVERTAPRAKAGEIQNNIGCIYETEGKLDEALAKYSLALALDPSLNFTHFNIARIYFAKKDTVMAAGEILKSFPEIKVASDRLKPYLEIVREYLSSLKYMGYAATFYNNLGVRFASGNLLDAAIACFQRVLDTEPRYADAHFNLGLAYWKMGLRRRAIFAFKTALKIDPNHPKAARFLSEIVYKK